MSKASWYQKNKERLQKKHKEWRDNNKDRVKEHRKEWAKNNPEILKEIQRKWVEKNSETLKEKRRNRNQIQKAEITLGQQAQEKIGKMLVKYYDSCTHNYHYRMRILFKVVDGKAVAMKRLEKFKNHKKWNVLLDIFLPDLYIENIVFFYYDYYHRHYKTEDAQKFHLEKMIVLAKKQNILFPENLIYETFYEQQSLVFYILFQMHEKYWKTCEDFVTILDKAGFERRFILEPFPFEKGE